jgi:hypothetical protein
MSASIYGGGGGEVTESTRRGLPPLLLVPSTALESMQLGGLSGITTLTMGLGKEGKAKEAAAGPA